MTKVGTIIGGKYEILKKIGQGGMSVVYVAMDTRLNKQWAIKEIKTGKHQNTETLLKSLQTEANILKLVDHPVLPRIVDIIDNDGVIYVVMDYIEGQTLSEILKVEGAQPQEQVIEWAKELCGALDYLHSMNPPIIYRDMKPSNIMVRPDGKVKLIDFGIAKELDQENVADTTALGTRGYAAPEQFGDSEGRGIHRTDERTDIYSLGASLYHILTGKNPSEPPYIIKPIREWNPHLSSGLEKIISKCTMPNPDERFQSASELLYALEHYNELDDAFRKETFKKLRGFIVSTGFCLASIAVALFGYVGMIREKNSNYETVMNEAYSHVIQADYDEAANDYIYAITEIDGTRNTAYIELLNLYMNYTGDPEAGLNKVTYYIDQKYQNIHRDQELLLNVAMDYFDVVKDYKSSAYYFNMLDKKKHPEAEYYSTIAMAMGALNVDYKELEQNLAKFEQENDGLTITVNKFMNYRMLCEVYARNLNNLSQAGEHVVEAATKGLSMLNDYEDDSIKAEYYILYNQYLAQAYQYIGDTTENIDEANGYYEKALESCDFILGMISARDEQTIERISDLQLREAKYCQKAEIYEQMGNYDEALHTYEIAEKEYRNQSISIYVGHLTLLCKMQEQKTTDVEQWDYALLHAFYEEAGKVPDMENDYRFKQLTQKLYPLFEGNGD